MLTLTEPLRTERLVLRLFVADDVPAVYAYLSLPDVVRYLYWEVQSLDGVREVLDSRAGMTRLVADDDRLYLAVARASDDQLLGEVMLRLRSADHRQVEIGFVFHPDYHGHGYATEAARAMLDLAFDNGAAHRVFGRADGRNDASSALMRRLGMRKEAHFRQNELFKGEWGDEVVYAILGDEWRAQPGRTTTT